MAVQSKRQARSREILDATRALIDERGVRDAQIEDIARAVGINRAIIYRHFSGKEELFAMILVGYLGELAESLQAVDDPAAPPPERLGSLVRAFLEFGEKWPAFVDSAHALLRRQGSELMEEVSEAVMFRLGRRMGQCMSIVAAVLEEGRESGVFTVDDPYLLANVYYTQGLGLLNLATLQLAVRQQNPGLPAIDDVSFDKVKELAVISALAMAGTRPV